MKLTVTVILLLCAVVCVVSSQVEQDKKKLKKMVRETANADLEAFDDEEEASRGRFYNTPLTIVKKVKQNNENILNKVQGLKTLMSSGSDSSAEQLLAKVTKVLSGERDNFSFYSLEACRQWANKRKQLTQWDEKMDLELIEGWCEVARDKIETISDVLESGLKEIKEMSGTAASAGQVKEAVQRILDFTIGNQSTLEDCLDRVVPFLEQKVGQ